MTERDEAPVAAGASASGMETVVANSTDGGDLAARTLRSSSSSLPVAVGLAALLSTAENSRTIKDFAPAMFAQVAADMEVKRIPFSWLRDKLRAAGVPVKLVDSFLFHLVVRHPEFPDATDLSLARRLVARHGQDLLHVRNVGWHVWDGRRWSPDEGEAGNRVKALADELGDDADLVAALASRARDDDEREFLRSVWTAHRNASNKAQSASKIKNALNLASTEPGIGVAPSDLDRNGNVLNVLNGTIDLRTGRLGQHCREDRITRVAPVVYDAEAESEDWDRFLAATTGGDANLLDYLQRVAGYSLLGCTPEEVFFFVHGPGASGKSTFIEALRASLGDYAAVADFESFIKKPAGGVPNDIARLASVRFVASIEVDDGRELAQGLVKTITGGDTVTARFLFKEHFEFEPKFALFLVANHEPTIDASDDAMWRRVRVLPFVNAVPPHERDPGLKARLRDPGRSGAAVLAWAVRGVQRYIQDGLQPPPVVTEAGEDYRRSMDPVGQFLDDECDLHAQLSVPTADLYAAYRYWCMNEGHPVHTQKALAPHLRRHGLRPGKTSRGQRVWTGLGLRPPGAYAPPGSYAPLNLPPMSLQVGGNTEAGVADEADGWGTEK